MSAAPIHRRLGLLVGLLFAGALLAAGAASASDLQVFNGRVTLPVGGESPSAYFVLRNGSPATRTIVGASCECAESVALRLTAISEDGQWSSEGLPDGMPIPAGGDVAFAPRGLFLRLMSPSGLAAGEKVEIVLEFADGERVPFEAVVEED